MDPLTTELYGNSLTAWLTALGVTLAVALGLRILQSFLARRLQALAERTEVEAYELLGDLAARTRFLLLVIIAVYVGSLGLTLPEPLPGVFRLAATLAALAQGGFWGTGVVNHLVAQRLKQEEIEEDAVGATTVSALGYVGRLAVWVLVLLLALENVGVEVTALVASLGIGGIAVALAVQNILGDLFSSLAIVFDKPFVIGDFIIVDDYLGTVEKIGLKTTRIRSLFGEQIVFSNSDLMGSRIRNYKRMFERRVVFSFGVVYGTPHEIVERIPAMVKEIVEQQETTRFDRAHFKEYGDFALNFEVVYYVLDPDYNLYMDIQERINLAIMKRFQEEGIEFAYPTQTLILAKEGEQRGEGSER
ncbi:MAG: mechanosensitive ion channel family protein [Anaerolineae bacterium]